MKLLVALCLMAAGVSAQYGESGIVNPDGTLVQFTREEADNIAEIGESGVVFHDGSHRQFGMEFAAQHNNLPAPDKPEEVPFGPYGYHGIMKPDGVNRQFTADEYNNVVLVGPSGVITKTGNIQFGQGGLPVRKRRGASEAVVGASGYILPDGTPVQLLPGESVVSHGPSGLVLSHGRNEQFSRKKRAVLYQGPSGVHFADGQLRHLPVDVTVVLVGPSGATLSNGQHVQFREKRSAPGLAGPSGYLLPDGTPVQLLPGQSVAAHGPSGFVLSTGKNVQFSRKKRQATSKATLGESGIITPGGRQIQLPHGVHVVLEGPSAALLSNGDYVQYEF